MDGSHQTAPVHRIPLVGGNFALVDACDAHLARQYTWRPGGSNNSYAVALVTTATSGRFQTHYLHREVLGAGPGDNVDHINGVRLDCRRANLRFATRSENSANRQFTDNPTGYMCVVYHATRRRWQGRVMCDGGNYQAPYQETPEAAARDADRLLRGLFGDNATFNFPRKGERGVKRRQP